MGVAPIHVLYAVTPEALFVRLLSSPTFRVCPALAELVSEHTAGAPREVRVDLAACEYLDSTFAGWLIRTHKQLRTTGGELVLAHCSPGCCKSLANMGLSSYFRFRDDPPPPDLRRLTCFDPAEAYAESLELALEAHEELAQVGAANEELFGRIAASFGRDVRAHKAR